MRRSVRAGRFDLLLSAGVVCRSLAIGTFLAAVMLFASPAFARTAEAIPDPSTIKTIDENGVDLMGGGLYWPSMDQSIGTSESGMHLFRQNNSAKGMSDPEYFDDNYTAYFKFRNVSGPTSSQLNHIDVKYGDVVNRFLPVKGDGAPGIPYKGGGGSFSCSANLCTYTDVQGAIIEFAPRFFSDGVVESGTATRIIKPDGEIITFGGGISSSLGWMIKKTQGAYIFRMINSAADYCDPAATNCDTLTAYPAFNHWTDVMGKGWSYTPLGTETRPQDGLPVSVLKVADPRGVETVWRQGQGGSQAPAWFANRVTSVTRNGQTSTYTTSYLEPNCCDWMAPLYAWRMLVIPPGGRIQLLEFNPNWSQVNLYVNELGHGTTQTYLNDQVNSVTALSGITTTYTRDSRNNITSATIRPKNGANNGSEDIIVATAIYPATCTNPKTCNKPTSVTDARNNTTTYTYDPDHGGVRTVTKPAVNGVQAQTRYDYQPFTPYLKTSAGGTQAQPVVWRLVSTATCRTMTLATCAGTTDELKTTLAYDPSSSAYGARNLLPLSKTVSRGDGSLATTVNFTYDRYGNVIVEDGPRPGADDAVYSFYDLKRRKIGSIGGDPDGSDPLPRAAVRTVYGADGQVESVAKGTVTDTTLAALQAMTPTERVATEYSTATGLPTVERRYATGASPVGVKQMSYDVRRRLECVALRMNPAAFGSLPASACTLGVEGSNGPDRITKNVYDPAGQLLQVRKGVGTPIETADATWTYTRAGGKVDVIDGNGNHAKFVYDKYDRLYQWQFPSTARPSAFDASTPDTALASAGSVNTGDYEQYGYDLAGNRTSLRKRDSNVINYTYDALNRVTQKSGAAVAGVDYSYDLMGHQLTATYSTGGQGITNAYNALGQLTSSTNDMGGTTRTLNYLYDDYGNRKRLTWPDAQFVTFEYDGLNRMSKVKESDATTLATYTYNALALPESRTNGAAVSTYGFDEIGRLTSLGHDLAGTGADVAWTFGYNPASQLISNGLSNSAYAWNGGAAFDRSYTTNGLNQYSAAGSASFGYDANGNLTSDGSTSFIYDVENRLTSASGATTATLNYDPLGRLYQTAGAGGAGITRFLYDGDELVAEYDGAGALLRRYVHGSAVDDPIVWYEGASLSDRRHLFTDWQGSIVARANAAGSSLGINSYDEYGIPGSGNAGRFQYTGQAWLSELGMYYYKARIYSPTLGRFLQTDPIGYKDQMNLYAYVGDDPVNTVDPQGTDGKELYDWAKNKMWDRGYSQASRYNGMDGEYTRPWALSGGQGLPKCNWFIADGLRQTDFKGSVVSPSGHVWGAHAWGDRNQYIPGMHIISDHKKLMPGDIIAVMHGTGGHVGIFAYGGANGTTPGVISANDDNGVRWAPWPASDKSVGENYVARRQDVDAPHLPPPPRCGPGTGKCER